MKTEVDRLKSIFEDNSKILIGKGRWEDVQDLFFDHLHERDKPDFRHKMRLPAENTGMMETVKELIDVVASSNKDFVVVKEKILYKLKNCEHRKLYDAIQGSSRQLWFQIPESEEQFFGRHEELKKLEIMIESNNQAFTIIWGQIGMGKSRLVTKFLKNRKSKFTHSAWLNCETTSDFLQSCSSMQIKVEKNYSIQIPVNKVSKKVSDSIELLLEICSKLSKLLGEKLILVLDNCTESLAEQLIDANFLEKCHKSTHLIIISRPRLLPFSNAGLDITLNSFSSQESLSYIKYLFKKYHESPKLVKLLPKLCYICNHCPLELKNVVNVMLANESKSLNSIEEVVEKFLEDMAQSTTTKNRSKTEECTQIQDHDSYSEILITTIKTIIDPNAILLLQFLPYVKRSDLPFEFLEKLFNVGEKKTREQFVSGLIILQNWNLIVLQKTTKTVEVNYTSQNSGIYDPSGKGVARVKLFLLQLTLKDLQTFEIREMRQIVEFFSHCIHLHNASELYPIADLIIRKFESLQLRNEILELSSKILENSLFSEKWNRETKQDKTVLDLFSKFASSLTEFSRFDEALIVYEYVHENQINHYQENPKIALDTLHSIAGIWYEKKDSTQAMILYKKVLEGRSAPALDGNPLYPAHSPKILATKANIANTNMQTKNYQLAREEFQNIIRIQEKYAYKEELLQSNRSLGYCFYKQKKYEDAEPLLREAVEIEDLRFKLIAQFNLGRNLVHMKSKTEEGCSWLREVLQNQIKHYGEKHEDTMKTLKNLQKHCAHFQRQLDTCDELKTDIGLDPRPESLETESDADVLFQDKIDVSTTTEDVRSSGVEMKHENDQVIEKLSKIIKSNLQATVNSNGIGKYESLIFLGFLCFLGFLATLGFLIVLLKYG